jgi:biotin transport system substrate-specific component
MLDKSTSTQIKKMALAIFFIALFAQITINLPAQSGDIPITGQTFAVLLVGYFLGRKWGTLVVLFYVILGSVGLPIFADGESGIDILFGGSGGFIFGFIAGAFLVGWLSELGWTASFQKSLIAMTLGTITIIIFGVARLTYLYDFKSALEWGFYPFIIGGLIKIMLGAAVLPVYHKLSPTQR